MLQAKTIMKRNVITVHPQDTLEKVIQLLVRFNISGLPVVNEDKTLAGIITEKDVLTYLLDKNAFELMKDNALWEHTVYHAMTTQVVSFDEDTPLKDICSCLVNRHFRRVPIINKNGVLVGIISRKDIIALIS
ncbi:MAG: CBS domain-containing protein [Planctomycetales bacterium]|nr:CBS domain-containing protein [Planctomycetales bacterium]